MTIAKLKVEKQMLKEENLTGEHPEDSIDDAIAEATGSSSHKDKKTAKVLKAIAKTSQKKV